MLNSVTGLDFTHEEMLKTGERIWNLERMFNLRAGFTKEDDNLPRRMLEEPAPGGRPRGMWCRWRRCWKSTIGSEAGMRTGSLPRRNEENWDCKPLQQG